MRMRSLFVALVFSLVVCQIHGTDITVCEGDKQHIKCDTSNDYKKINILAADYGRSDAKTCKGFFDIILNTNCHADRAMEITQEECQDFSSCTVYANNGEYGDPCGLVKKYLTVSYECVKTKANVLRQVRVCEGDEETIECPAGRKLDIEYAMYGRLRGGHVCNAFIPLSTNCVAEDSLVVVGEDCQGKRSCVLEANNDKFGGDPCFIFTKKYLDVKYRCVKRVKD